MNEENNNIMSIQTSIAIPLDGVSKIDIDHANIYANEQIVNIFKYSVEQHIEFPGKNKVVNSSGLINNVDCKCKKHRLIDDKTVIPLMNESEQPDIICDKI